MWYLTVLPQTEGTICYGHGFLHLVVSYSRQGVGFVTGMRFCIFWCLTADRGYYLLQAWGSASCIILQRTSRTTCYEHGVLHLIVSCSKKEVRFVMGMCLCILCYLRADGGRICYGHGVLPLVVSYSRQGIRFVTGMGFCFLWYLTADRRYDSLRASSSASFDITQQTGGTICYGHGVLHLVVSYSRREVRFVTGMKFCILWYLASVRGYDLLRA